MFATAATFFKNFSIPCLWIALGAGLLAGAGGFYAGLRWSAGDVAKAENKTLTVEKQLSDYTATVALSTATAITAGMAKQTQAADAVRVLRDDIIVAINAGFAPLRSELRATADKFRSYTNDPKYTCLDLPLPDDALRLYERPGGSATPAPAR